jgi:hypothetical protein
VRHVGREAQKIKLAPDTIDLEILRWVLDEAMSKNLVDRQQYYRLVRDLLAGAT